MILSQKTGLRYISLRGTALFILSIRGIIVDQINTSASKLKTQDNSQPAQDTFTQADKQGLYKTIFNRRDVRGQFLPTPIPDEVLSRVLYASHHAPSVGFMQPWDYIVIRSNEIKEKVKQDFNLAHQEAEQMFSSEKQATYKNLKLEGITESPINICITCDRERTGETVIGRTHMKEMDLYSSVCAVQNFWLAARSENLGVGWVSILHHDALRATLNLPTNIVPIAYLCVGYVSHFHQAPELETANWLPRRPLIDAIKYEQWGKENSEDSLSQQVNKDADFVKQFLK